MTGPQWGKHRTRRRDDCAPSGAHPRLTGRSVLCSEHGSLSKRRRRLSTVVASREKGSRSKGQWNAKTSSVRARRTEGTAQTPTPEEAYAMAVRRRRKNGRWATRCLGIWFRGLTFSLRGRPGAKPAGNLQAQLAGGPLEARVRPRWLATRTRRTGSGEPAATRETKTGGQNNSGLRRSAGRRKQRNGFLAALRDTTTFARTPKRERPEKDCALGRKAKTDLPFLALFRARFVGQAKAASFYGRARPRKRWPKQRTVERQDIGGSRTLHGRNSPNTAA